MTLPSATRERSTESSRTGNITPQNPHFLIRVFDNASAMTRIAESVPLEPKVLSPRPSTAPTMLALEVGNGARERSIPRIALHSEPPA